MEVDLLPGVSRLVVTVSPQAYQTIVATLAPVAGTQLESGGWLLGTIDNRGERARIEILCATGLGNGRSKPYEVQFATADSHEAEQTYGLPVVGSYHSHPDTSTWPQPSTPDISHWASILRYGKRLAGSVGVIVVPSAAGGWTAPLLAAWGVERDASGRFICQKASVV